MNLKIFYFLNNLADRSSFGNGLILFFAEYLTYVLLLIFAGYVYLAFRSWRERGIVFVTTAAAATLARLVLTELIRFFYHHPRPYITLTVHQLLPSENSYSFPSGHASLFFAVSTVIYAYNRKLGTFFFVASFVMGLARIAAGIHFPLDIAGGAVVGVISGFIVLKLRDKLLKQK